MKAIEKQILDIYSRVYAKIYTKDRIKDLTKSDPTSIIKAALTLAGSEKYTEFSEKFAKELASKGIRYKRGLWRKYYNVAKRLHVVGLPTTFHEYEMKAYSEAVKQNFTLIKSIPEDTLKLMEHKYCSTLIEQVAKGKLPRGTFEKELKSHGYKNAKLIARTETAKLQTTITEVRAKAIGSVAYEWVASNDKRTRPSHRAMNGVIVFYRPPLEKPKLDGMQGNAGEFPNCRCDTFPIVDLDELTENKYKVYDYRSFKIIEMTRKELIEALSNGGL